MAYKITFFFLILRLNTQRLYNLVYTERRSLNWRELFKGGKKFSGNPAVVCFLPDERDPAWMQQVAREMNLSETAFLVSHADGHSLRWFTPEVEVDLCGHATLAAAHALWETDTIDAGMPARFHTRSGQCFG